MNTLEPLYALNLRNFQSRPLAAILKLVSRYLQGASYGFFFRKLHLRIEMDDHSKNLIFSNPIKALLGRPVNLNLVFVCWTRLER